MLERRFFVVAAVLAACASPAPLQLETGSDAVVTADQLHRVAGMPFGALYMKRDYAFGTYDSFVMGQTRLTLEPDSLVLSDEEIEEVKARFSEVVRSVIAETGRVEVAEAEACVAVVNLWLLDLKLIDRKRAGEGSDHTLASFGEVTLLMEIRDGATGEALLRYGHRYGRPREIQGGPIWRGGRSEGPVLAAAFDRFTDDFRQDFNDSVPRVAPTAPPLTCEQRAGLSPVDPKATADREIRQALAVVPSAAAGEKLYASCAQCHGPDGGGLPDGSVPRIAGQLPRVVIKQLADIRAGNRDNPTMYAFAAETRLDSPQAIADVAAWVAGLETGVQIDRAPGDDPERGRALYEAQCAECHGSAGEGNDAGFVPRLEGQHPAYLARQIQWIKEGGRHNADPEMRRRVQELSSQDIATILGYVSQL